MTAIGNLFRYRHLLKPLMELSRRYVDSDGDRWVSVDMPLGPAWFGSRFDFWRYLEGKSAVSIGDFQQLCEWLLSCEYVSDRDLFRESDYWQHPLTFEQLRRGDCEDHALWAWRKLGELGLPARFFVGRWQWNPEQPSFHAWVVFEDRYDRWLLEGTAHDIESMKRPFEEARAEYKPHLSVGHFRDVKAYGGWVEYRAWLRSDQGRRWRKGQSRGRDDPSWNLSAEPAV